MPANVPIYGDQGGAHQHIGSGGVFTIESGGTLDIAAGALLSQDGVAFDRMVKVAKVALGALDTAGGVLAWANPEGVSIIVSRVMINITTVSTGAGTADVGVAANGTTSGNNLMTALNTNAAAGLFDNIEDKGASGKARQLVTASQFVTASRASGAMAGLVGFAYIQYFRV